MSTRQLGVRMSGQERRAAIIEAAQKVFVQATDESVVINDEIIVLLYWVIDVDETFVAAIGYVPCGDRVVQARCDPTSVGTRRQCGLVCRNRWHVACVAQAACGFAEP